jgi:hypothetical protein
VGGWHYWRRFDRNPWRFWWTVPTWAVLTNWFNWGTPVVWTQPVFYDFGPQGNVVFQDNSVLIGGERVASTAEFAMSAADLATVPPPASESEAEAAEWLPLGTFAVSTDEEEVEPAWVMQLAVSREGIIAGTLFNTETDEAQTVQGRVDKDTQRVAMRIGDSESFVAETGLGNLLQDEAPLLVHFGPDDVETWLLIRLEAPEETAEEGE